MAGAKYIAAPVQALDDGISGLGNIRVLEDYAIELERKRRNYDAALLRLDRIIDRSARKESLLTRCGEILLEAGQLAEAEVDFAAARKAIDELPPRRRHTPAMRQMRAAIDNRIHSLRPHDDRE